jgi:predicted dehydrogenase
MKEKIRFGILSFAHYHANFWCEAINRSDHAKLVGIWDDDTQRGVEASEKYHTSYFSNLDVLLANCDAAGITSETARHADLVEKAANAGVHILLEKPMGTSVVECARIYRAVHDSKIIFMQNFPKRYDPVNHELIRMVHGGELGMISLVRVRHGNYHLLELGSKASEMWYANPELSGGGALIDEGIHAADFLLWLLGEPSKVFSITSKRILGLPVEDTALAVFSYPSGTLAEIVTSNTLVAAEDSIEVYGTEGSTILSGVDLASRDFSTAPFLRTFRRGGERGHWQGSKTTPRFLHGEFHQQGPLHFIECLISNKEPIVSLEEAWKSVAMIEAAYRASETGQAQEINLSGKPRL